MRSISFQFATRWSSLIVTAGLVLAAGAAGGEPTVAISGSAPKTVHHGGKLIAKVRFQVPAGFHIYSPSYKSPDGTGVPVTFDLEAPRGFKLLRPKAPAGGELKGAVSIWVPIAVPASAKGLTRLGLVVHYQQCNDRICLPPAKETLSLSTTVK